MLQAWAAAVTPQRWIHVVWLVCWPITLLLTVHASTRYTCVHAFAEFSTRNLIGTQIIELVANKSYDVLHKINAQACHTDYWACHKQVVWRWTRITELSVNQSYDVLREYLSLPQASHPTRITKLAAKQVIQCHYYKKSIFKCLTSWDFFLGRQRRLLACR